MYLQNGTLKTTHIVIQDSTESSATASSNAASTSWAEAANMPVLPVRCKV